MTDASSREYEIRFTASALEMLDAIKDRRELGSTEEPNK